MGDCMMIFNKGKILVLLLVMMMGLSLLSLTPSVKADTVDWMLEGQSPGERTSFVSAELTDGRVFVALGYNSSATEHINDTWIFDPYEVTWTQVADSPVMTESSTGAYLNGTVFIFGGMLSNYTHMLTVLMYDVEADTWSTGPAMPRTGTYFQSVAIDDRYIMVVGGGTSNTEKCYLFDTVTMTFTDAPDLPDGRAGGTLVMFDNYLLYFGGWDDSLTVHDEIFGYDLSYDYWWSAGSLPEPMAGITAVAGSDGLIYLMGGSLSINWYSANLKTAYAFNINNEKFIDLPELAEPFKYGAATELNDGRIMYFGGHNSSVGNLDIYSLQIWEKEAWLTSSSVDQGDSAFLNVRIKTNFADMDGLYGTVYLTQGDVTVGWFELNSVGTNQLLLEMPISESMAAGNYLLIFDNVNTGWWGQNFKFDPLSLSVTEAPSTSDNLQEIMDQNQEIMDQNAALQDQISALNDDLNDTRADLADVQDSVDGKMDAMFGYVILILVLITLVIGVVILVRKK